MSGKPKNKDKNISNEQIGWYSLAVVLDTQACIKYVSSLLASQLGYTVNELLGKDAIKLIIPKKNWEDRRSQIEFLFKQESVVDAFNIQLVGKDQRKINIQFNILKIGTYSNQEIAFIGDDLSISKVVKTKPTDEESELLELVESAREIVVIIDGKEKVKSINQTGENRLGIKKGMCLRDLLESKVAKKTTSFLNSLSNISSNANINLMFLHPSSKQRYYLKGTVSSIVSKGKLKEFRLILHDVTEDIKTEQAKNLYYTIAHHSIHSKDLDELYYNIHKELRKVIECDNMYIALVEENDGEDVLSFPYYQELAIEPIGKSQRKFANGLTEYVISIERPLLLNSKELLRLVDQEKLDIHGKIPATWMGVPLKIKSNVMGVIVIQSYEENTLYTSRDLKLLDFASSQIAIAVNMVRTHEKLLSQTAKLNSIIESGSHLIWTIDSNYDLTSFNKNYFDAIINNYDVMPTIQDGGGVKGKSFDSFWEKKYSQAFAGKQLNFEIKLKDKNGDDLWKEIYLNPIYLEDGSIEEVSGIANDITEKKKSQAALVESEEKFRNIFESFQDIYFRCNRNGHVTMVSPSIESVTGLKPNEVIGKNINLFFVKDAPHIKYLKRLLQYKHIQNVEFSVLAKNDRIIECICNLSLIYDANNKPILIEGVVRDITELKLTNKELVKAKNEAETLLQVKEEFLANMSHEIRTPLNGIIGVLDLLQQTHLAKDQGSYLKTIKSSSETLLNILNDILDLSKIEAGKMQLRPAPIAPKQLINKLKSLFEPRASMHHIQLKFHLDSQVPEVIEADEMRLIQIISNLVANSIKFTPKGGSIDIGINLKEVKRKDLTLKIDVRDSGIGIQKVDIDKLFTSFTQLDNSTTKSYSGTGLGLSISKQLVEIMGGEIGVFSNPGLGSTFWFSFKAKKSTKKLIAKKNDIESTIKVSPFTENIPYILVVDDNLVNRNVAGEILSKSGCKVDLASNGIEAVFKAKENNYDIIFMDIQITELDGIEANRQIKNLYKKKQPLVVAMTAYSMKEDEERFLSAGLDDYLAKPIRATQIIAMVHRIMTGVAVEPAVMNKKTKHDLRKIINQEVIAQLEKYGGNEMVYNTMKEFEKEAKMQLNECMDAIKSNDYSSIQKTLHTLKGSASTLGIEKMAATAKALEVKLKKEDYTTLKEGLLELNDNFVEFKENFTNIISN